MSGGELAGLLRQIAGESTYEVLVVDVGSVRRELFELLGCFDTIYMPVKDDCVSAGKAGRIRGTSEIGWKTGIEGKNPETETALSQQFWASGHLYGSASVGRTGRLCTPVVEGKWKEGGAEGKVVRMNSDEKDRIRALRERLKCQIREELNVRSQVDDEELCHLIDEKILESGQGCYLPLKEKLEIRTSLFDFFRRLDVLQHAMDDPQITEIMVNGARKIFVEEKGVVRQWEPVFESEEQLEDMIQQLVSQVNRIVNVSSPIVDARMPDGSRLHVVLPPVSLSGPLVTIRKFPRTITMKDMIESGSVSEEAADFLKRLVRANTISSSAAGQIREDDVFNSLSAWIPLDERVITIEDSAELQIQQVKNLVRLETKNANGEGEGAIGIGDLIRASLRMNPSRIIVGEVRGKEALELLNAYNTGHDGGLSTGHGNSPKDMLARLETMMLMGASLPLAAIGSQIASGLDVMVHLGRLRDKSRRVLRITEVGGYHDGEIELWDLYRFEEEADQEPDIQTVQGTLRKVGELRQKEKLMAAGDFL